MFTPHRISGFGSLRMKMKEWSEVQTASFGPTETPWEWTHFQTVNALMRADKLTQMFQIHAVRSRTRKISGLMMEEKHVNTVDRLALWSYLVAEMLWRFSFLEKNQHLCRNLTRLLFSWVHFLDFVVLSKCLSWQKCGRGQARLVGGTVCWTRPGRLF